MKKMISLLLIALLLLSVAPVFSDSELSYSEMSDDDLLALRQSVLNELTEINTELGKRIHHGESSASDGESLGKIRDLFPDEEFAVMIRDKTQKFTIDQTVTQADLDGITYLQFDYWPRADLPPQVTDLTGIGLLRHLEKIYMDYSVIQTLPDEMRNCTCLSSIRIYRSALREIPEWIGELAVLNELTISNGSSAANSTAGECNLTVLPDSIGDLTLLEELDLQGNCLSVIPESIGNLQNLKKLYLAGNFLTTLPDSVGSLINLSSLSLDNNNISVLPESIYNLNLEYLSLSGNPIR